MTYATLEARREAREAVSGMGKFEGEPAIVPILWNMVGDGAYSAEEYGDDDVLYSRIGRWIVWEDDFGFVHSARFESADAAQEALDDVVSDSGMVESELNTWEPGSRI